MRGFACGLLFLVSILISGCGGGGDSSAESKLPPDPYRAEIAAIRERIAELQREYEQNRAKVQLDLKGALERAKAEDVDSDHLLLEVTQLTKTVADSTKAMRSLTHRVREQLKAAGQPPAKEAVNVQ